MSTSNTPLLDDPARPTLGRIYSPEPAPIVIMEDADDAIQLRADLARLRKLLAVFVNIGYGNRTPHSPECGCDLCEALHAARKELGVVTKQEVQAIAARVNELADRRRKQRL